MPQRNSLTAVAFGCILIVLGGCAKGSSDFDQGKKAEALHDYETALAAYNRALKSDPQNAEYKLHADQVRFEAAQACIEQGEKLREKGDLEMAVAEFRKAGELDPSSPAADEEVKKTLDLINARAAAAAAAPGNAPEESADENDLATGPPELKPLSITPINLKMANDSKTVFETIAKLAGLTVVFDPDFTSRRITVDLDNVTLEQALDVASLESKASWKPLTSNIIFVTLDQLQKHRDYDEEIVKTFYIKNSIQSQDLQDLVTSLRALLDLKRIQQINSMNAIVIRDTPDKVMLAGKIIDDVDRARPEVIVQAEVLVANRDRMRDLGITPGTSITLAPNSTSSTSSSSSTSGTSVAATLGLNQKLSLRSDYSITLPSATANALMTDSTTHTIQSPEIRMVDGEDAKLDVGDKVPVATGSFQAGVGTSAASVVSPLVNTQFQYEQVGVSLDITPRIHPDNSVTLKMKIDVSAVVATIPIGGINEPEIGDDQTEQEVRLTDGEVSIIGGLMTRDTVQSVSGWPGLAKIPIMRYFVADNQNTNNDDELLIVLTPHIIRLPDITPESLKSFYSGTETTPAVLMAEDNAAAPAAATPPATVATPAPAPATVIGSASAPTGATPSTMAMAPAPGASSAPAAPMQATPGEGARLRFDPPSVSLKPGETTTISVVADNVEDLFSIPILLQYDPKVISVEAVSQGGFLSGGTQEIALVDRVDKDRGQAVVSATRMPHTAGVNGTGTLFGIQIRALAPGQTNLSIVQTNARDSQQHAIPLVTGETSIEVK
ncbi:MAG: cohesin domain-containing protein [Candidatus Acidiferrales bacterium]